MPNLHQKNNGKQQVVFQKYLMDFKSKKQVQEFNDLLLSKYFNHICIFNTFQNYIYLFTMRVLLRIVLIVAATLLFVNCDQKVPIPEKQYGFTIGDKNGLFHLQFIIDFQCPDSKDSYYAIMEAIQSISLDARKIKFTYLFNPLPWHFYSFKIHQAFFFILEKRGQASATDFISYVFKNQDDLTQQVWYNKTAEQFLDEFSHDLAAHFFVNQRQLRDALNFGTPKFDSARKDWKYTVGEKAVQGAPAFFANGVRINGAEQYRRSQWIDFFNKYTK